MQRCLCTISWVLISAVLACLVVAAEVRPDQRDTAPSVSIIMRGSDAFIDLTNQWLSAFGMQSEGAVVVEVGKRPFFFYTIEGNPSFNHLS